MIVNLPVNADAAVLGEIVSVSGSRLSAVLATARAPGAAQVRIGDLLRIDAADGAVFGIAQSLHAVEAREERRTVEIDVFGEMNEANGHFQRGVSRHPVLGARVCATTSAPPTSLPLASVGGTPEMNSSSPNWTASQ